MSAHAGENSRVLVLEHLEDSDLATLAEVWGVADAVSGRRDEALTAIRGSLQVGGASDLDIQTRLMHSVLYTAPLWCTASDLHNIVGRRVFCKGTLEASPYHFAPQTPPFARTLLRP